MPKQTNDAIVTFRVTSTRQRALNDYATKTKVVDVRSHHQMGRKLVLDFLDGKLIYLAESHKFARPAD